MTQSVPPIEPGQLGAYLSLIETSSLLRRAVEQQLLDAGGLSYVQFQLLATLGDAESGSMRMTDLADGVVFSRSGLTYQAQSLESRGLITRAPSAEDERSVIVTLTDAGRSVLSVVFPGHLAILGEMFLAPLSPSDVRSLDEILGRVRDHMRRVPARATGSRRRRTA